MKELANKLMELAATVIAFASVAALIYLAIRFWCFALAFIYLGLGVIASLYYIEHAPKLTKKYPLLVGFPYVILVIIIWLPLTIILLLANGIHNIIKKL